MTVPTEEYSRQRRAEISTSPLPESREVGHLAISLSTMSAPDSHMNYGTADSATFPSTLNISPLSGITTTASFVPFHFSRSLVPMRGPLTTSGALPLTTPSSQPSVVFTSAGDRLMSHLAHHYLQVVQCLSRLVHLPHLMYHLFHPARYLSHLVSTHLHPRRTLHLAYPTLWLPPLLR